VLWRSGLYARFERMFMTRACWLTNFFHKPFTAVSEGSVGLVS